MRRSQHSDHVPDVRDGLSRVERVVLATLARTQAELGNRSVSSAMLYGRVSEQLSISIEEFQRVLRRLSGRG